MKTDSFSLGSDTFSTVWRLAAATFSTLILATLPVLALVPPEKSSPLTSRAVRHPELTFRGVHRAVDGLPADHASAAHRDLDALGSTTAGLAFETARIDVRGGRWSTLVAAHPLVPGTGTGNALTRDDPAKAAAPGTGDFERTARQAFVGFLAANEATLRIAPGELGTGTRTIVHGDGALIQIYAPREVDGIPVRGSYVRAVINHGNLVLLGARKWGDVDTAATPRLGAEDALQAAEQFLAPLLATRWTKPHLTFVPTARGQAPPEDAFARGYGHRLAWVTRPVLDGENGTWELLVDAHSGEILAFEDLNHYASDREVRGGVYPVSNDGQVPDGVEQPGWPMPFESIVTSLGPLTTDSGGNLPVPLDGNITSDLSGPFVRMDDNCGAISLTSSGDLDFGTSPGTDCDTPGFGGAGNTHASRSGFYELNRIREQARGQLPGNTWLDQQLTAVMNIDQSCNAFWNGFSVNFYRSGGGCANTGELAAVFDHEWGHGMDDNDALPFVSNPGEGIADLYAYLRLNDSCIGRNFGSGNCGGFGDPCTDCSGVREIDWAKRLSGQPHDVAWIDANCGSGGGTPCGGSTHCEGAVYAEAVYDLINRDLPALFGMDHNTALEVGTRLTYLGGGAVGAWFDCVTPFGGCNADGGYLNFLAVDDDNGNLADGTPHMSAIFAAFDRHGIACNTPAVQNGGCANTPASGPTVVGAPLDRGALLSWTAVAGATRYDVFRTDGVFACDFGKIKVGETTGTSFVDGGLQNGRATSYVVIPIGGGDSCLGPASACTTVTPVPGPNLTVDAGSGSLAIFGGDGDDFLDNCEQGTWTFDVDNSGAAPLTNVRIVSITPSNGAITVNTPLPATVASSIALGGSASGSFDFIAGGLTFGETVTFLVEVTADEIAPASRSATLAASLAESDFSTVAGRTYTFEISPEGWQVIQGTFDRTSSGGGAQGTAFYEASSSFLDSQCDHIRSPVLRLNANSTLEVWTQFDIEPAFSGVLFYDRANVGLYVPATGARTPVDPDGGRLYNASGQFGTCGTTGQDGWADAATTWAPSTWSAAALGTAGLTGQPVQLDIRYGTDQFLEGFGLHFDQVTLTHFDELQADGQADACTCDIDAECDDGRFCNGAETCVDNACQAGTPVVCDDGVACTVDACNETIDSCESTPSDSLCSNGLFCDGAETCDAVLGCQTAAPVDCDDAVACTADSCDEAQDTCVNAPDDAFCANGLFCDGVETCNPTAGCQAGPPVDCGDGVGCTVDVCDEAADSCGNTPDDSLCSNGVFCDGEEICDPALDCQAASPPCLFGCDEGANACVDPVPFACTGDAYIVQNQNAQLTLVDQTVAPFVFVPIGAATGIEINNLGFRSTDGLLYGVELTPGGNVQVVALDSNGTVFGLGRPAGLPTGPRFDAGDVSPDGSTMYITATNQALYRLDLTQLPILPAVTSVAITGANGFVFDWAVNPADGMLYGGDSTNGQLAILDPSTGARTDVNVAGLPSGAGYGGAWFASTGNLFLYQNDGNLYEIDLAGPTVVDTQTGPGATRNDGAACVVLAPPPPPPPSVGLDKTGTLDLGGNGTADVGDVIDYTFVITNTGGVELVNLTVSDPLVGTVSCPGGQPIASLAIGATMTCTATYALTQADLDAGVRDNTATVDADVTGAPPVSAQDSHSVIIPTGPPGGPIPFACTGDAYIVQNQNAQLTRIDQTVSPFVFVDIGSATGIEINNLGFRSTDGLLYGVELTTGGNVQVIQIDSTGAVFGLGRPAGLPTGPRFDAGDVSPDGSTMYITSNNQALYRLDLTSVPALPAVTSVPVSGASGFVFDWAVNPADGMLYGGDSTSGQLATLDPVTGVRTDVNLAGLPSGAGYGGAWFASTGNLFLYQNDGNLYEIDLAGPTVVNTRTGPGATRNDGAACVVLAPPPPPPPSVALDKTGTLDLGGNGTADVGDVIDYTFEITNTGGVELVNLTISDPLVGTVSCPGGQPIASLAIGATMTCTATYTLTQADLDAGVRDNTATVDADVTGGAPVSAQDSHSVILPTGPPGGPIPFACTGDAYIVQNQNAQLTRIDQAVSPFVFVNIGAATGIEINNLGFRSTDGLLYGVELTTGGNVQVIQIDSTGAVFGLGRPAGLPTGPRFDAGDVSPDGSTMYITSNNQALYRLDLTSVPALPAVTSVPVSGASGFVFDWAVNPADGMLYGGDSTSGQLATLDPVTGVRTDVNLSGLPSGAGYGGAWFDGAGHLFLYQNDGNLYEIDLAGPTVVNTQTGPGATRNDGAACVVLAPPPPPPPSVGLVKTGTLDLGANGTADVGDVIDYTFEITNTGGVELVNLTISDPLVGTVSCPGGQPIASLAIGATMTCTATYTLTQADLDAGVRDNTATVDADVTGAPPVSAQDSHSVVIPTGLPGGPIPFACTGDAYIVQNQNAQLTRIDQTVSPFVFVPIGSATGIEINNLGFRSTDGLLYGLELTSGGNVQVIQIDSTGAIFGLGRPAGLPTGPRFDAGDVSPDGSTMYITSNNQALYRLDLTSVPTLPAVTSVPVSGASGFVFDWAVNPADGMLYGGDSTSGQLATLDPVTGVRTDVNVAGLPSGSGYGGAWFDSTGRLFLYQNSGSLFEIDLAGPTVVNTQTGPGASRNDGAACIP